MRWLAWAAMLGLAASIAVASPAWQAQGISTEHEPIHHALVSADGRVVTVPALGGGCVRRVQLTTFETHRTVRLALTAYVVSGPHVACPAIAIALQASATLRAPLDGRTLVDVATGRPVPSMPRADNLPARTQRAPLLTTGPQSASEE